MVISGLLFVVNFLWTEVFAEIITFFFLFSYQDPLLDQQSVNDNVIPPVEASPLPNTHTLSSPLAPEESVS